MHSLGGVLGGAAAAAVAHLGLGVEGHFALVAAVAVVAALLANRTLLSRTGCTATRRRAPGRRRY
jgi:hypothetical protein